MKISKKVGLFIWLLMFCSAYATLNFSNNYSKFILQNANSEIRMKNTGIYDNQDSGITNNLNKIDFVNSTNNLLIMDDNFELDSGFLSSLSCTVQGNGHSMIMNGDLTIPAMTTLKITSSLTIEGNGHTLFIDNFAQLLTDPHTSLTLRNLIIKNSVNSSERAPIAGCASSSRITLDGVEIKFVDDFWFKNGSLFFNNNVLYSGGSKFLYCSPLSSYIAPSSTLLFDKGTTFFYNPASINSGLIVQQDPTSAIYFDGSTLQTTSTGLSLVNGKMFFENQINFDVGTEFNTSVFRLNQTDSSISLRYLDWDFTGQYLVASGQAINGNTDQIKFYQLDSTILSQLGTLKYGSLSSVVYSVVWSSDGQYLAVGGAGACPVTGFSNNDNLRIYYFDPATLNLNPVASVDFGITATVNSIDWGGVDGRYLAIGGTGALPVGGFGNSNNLRIYHFDVTQGKLNAVTSYNFGSSVNSAKWDFSGSYLAVGGYQTLGSCELNLFNFNPVTNSLNSVQAESFGTANDTSIKSLAWTSESQFLAVGGGSLTNYSVSTENLLIYQFNPANPAPLTFLTFASPVEIAATDHIQIQNLKWSPDNNLLLYAGINPASGKWSSDIYVFDASSDIKLSELKQMGHAISSDRYAATWNPSSNLFVASLSNYINVNSLVGLSPKLVSSQNYTTGYSTMDGIYAIDWHPGGDYLAVAGQGAGAVGGFNNNDAVRIYRFGSGTEFLHTTTSVGYGTRVCASSWSPDGGCLAVGGFNPSYGVGGFNNFDQVRVYNYANNLLTANTSVALGDSFGANAAALYSLAWHPSGQYIALGCYNSAATGGFLAGTNLRIYSFDGIRLTPVVGYNFVHYGNSLTPAGIAWSPDGTHLAVGTCLGQPTPELDLSLSPTTGNGLKIFEFQNNSSLVEKASWNGVSGATAVISVNWEYDNRFLAITYNDNFNPLAYAKFYFTGNLLEVIDEWGDSTGIANVDFFNTDVKFSPDGKKIATTAKNGYANSFGCLDIDDIDLKNESFHYQKIAGIFNLWTLAWRPDSKYIAIGAYNIDENAQQVSVFKVDNLINIDRQGARGLDIGNLVDANVLGNAQIIVNGVMSYAAQ